MIMVIFFFRTTVDCSHTATSVPVGSSIPKYTGGWNNTFNYKNLSLGVFIDYKLGGTVLSSTYLNMTRQGMSDLSLEGRRVYPDGTVEAGLVFPGVYDADPSPAVHASLTQLLLQIFRAFMQITGIFRSGILSHLSQILLS